ncbi:MAG: rhomboid family intramembrane serine protease [Lachnospiraceae bacterium]|nr:rhomboid family intramembrane serine protease [Lachnospiraceae bacterium]
MSYSKKKPIITFNSPIVLGFVLACFLVTIFGIISGGTMTRLLFMTYRSSLKNPLTYIRFFTYVLGHSGWNHFAGNAAYLLLLGPMLEEKYGPQMLGRIILITAIATSLINFILFPNVALCGASGIVFAFIILASFTGFKDGEIPLTFILVAVLYIGQQVVEGITIADNVSNMAHIIGGVVGAIVGYRLNVKKK